MWSCSPGARSTGSGPLVQVHWFRSTGSGPLVQVHWFSRFLELPNGIPCSDTFARVFARIDPDRFRDCFMEWVSSVHRLTQGQVIAVDGKTLRRSHDRRAGKEAIHMVSAWASENSLVLGQTRTDAKSNEITAIPELLQLLDVSATGRVRLHRHHRRHGLPERDRPDDPGPGGQLSAGGQGGPGEAVRGHPGPVPGPVRGGGGS